MADSFISVINSTLQKTLGSTKDVFQRSNALFSKLVDKSSYKGSYGPAVRMDLQFVQSNFGRFNGYSNIDISPVNSLLVASVSPVQYYSSQAISTREELINANNVQIRDLWKLRIEQSRKTLMRNLGADVYSDGSLQNQIAGLQYYIRTDPTTNTIVAGINQSTNADWRNRVANNGAPITTLDAQSMYRAMQDLALDCSISGSKVDLILAGNRAYTRFAAGMVANQRYTDGKMASLGFDGTKFNDTIDLVVDPGQCPNNSMFFLATEVMKMEHYVPGMIEAMEKEPTNQLAKAVILHWMGNLIVNDRSALGLLTIQ